jgi:hypothetical protein
MVIVLNISFNSPTFKSIMLPLLSIYLMECESSYSKGTCTSMFMTALFTIAKL